MSNLKAVDNAIIAKNKISSLADILSTAVTSELDNKFKISVTEMLKKRGADFSKSNSYQIRIKPENKEQTLDSIKESLLKVLASQKLKHFGVSDIEVNSLSPNSSKFSSISCDYMGVNFDFVIAAGGNKGEDFEKKLLSDLDNLVQGISNSEQAQSALDALQKIDKVFKIDNIKEVKARSGSTSRSSLMSSDEIGKTIADIIIILKNGDEKYISVKNSRGRTVAQFGISSTFSNELDVVDIDEWNKWFKPFGIDKTKVEIGLKAARDGADINFEEFDLTERNIPVHSAAFKIIASMWGTGYYYLREQSKGFKAIKIDDDFINNVLLKNIKIIQISYPGPNRKQINVYVESNSCKMKLEYRNPRATGSIKPTQVQLSIMQSDW